MRMFGVLDLETGMTGVRFSNRYPWDTKGQQCPPKALRLH